MNTNKNHEDKFLLSFADIFTLFRKSKMKIGCCALGLGLAGAIWGLTMPIRYLSEGTFREKAVKSSSVSISVLQVLSGGSTVAGESEANSLMTSRKILKNAIEELHLQANLESLSDIETTPKLIKRNLMLAWAALFRRSPEPILKDASCPLSIASLQYSGEIPLSFQLDLRKDGSFEVIDLVHDKKSVGLGELGNPFQYNGMLITLVERDPQHPVAPQSFCLTVNSLQNTVKELCTNLQVESAKLDKTLLTLKCENRDRHKASAIINAVMASYQSYLKNYHSDLANSQLEYLNQRRNHLTKNLTDVMEKHADYLSNGLFNSGFIETEKEIDFLAKNQYEYKGKLLENELETKRLTNIQPGNLAYYDRYNLHEGGDSSIINPILSEMRTLKQQRDSLEIELQKKAIQQGANPQFSFEQQLDELKEVQNYLNEVREISDQYEQGRLPDSHYKLISDSRFLLKEWIGRLQNEGYHSKNDLKETEENFKIYLNNLERLLSVHERILQERLTHHQNPSGEYQGISLELATSLYLEYSKQLIQIEGTIRQNSFFIHQIEDPNFEITSLSSGLTDSVSSGMIQKASELVLTLRDQNNQSMREQERIKDELNLQRTFLTMHLKQMVQLMELNKQLMDEKIYALQNVSLELIHQRISLLEKNLKDYLKSRLYNLQQERILIKGHLDSVYSEMAILPQKWVSEKLLTQEVETNKRIVEELIKLVESKNIAHKLEVIQSAPVDTAISPLHPKLPKVFILGIIGFIFGGIIGSGFVLGRALSKGLQISAQNLELMGYHVSGSLTSPLYSPVNKKIQESNMETLRRLLVYFDSRALAESSLNRIEAKFLLLIEGDGPHYAFELAHLFAKRDQRVLIIDLNLKEPKKQSGPGLLQFLQGEMSAPPIQKEAHGDWISSGGINFSCMELTGSSAFQKLIGQLKLQYDWILLASSASPISAEAESLLSLFSYAAITVNQEKVDDLSFYKHFLEQNSDHKLSFIIDES